MDYRAGRVLIQEVRGTGQTQTCEKETGTFV